MRLIDADRLLEDMKRRFGIFEEVEEVIHVQPTAYDLDKVKEDLDKFANGDICISCPKCRYVDEDNIECENCGALGALEIVKRGGLS